MNHEVLDAGGVAPLVVVPGDALDEVGVEHDAGAGIEGRGGGLGLEVSGHEGLVGVAEEALHVAVGAALDLSAELLVGGGLLDAAGEVDDGHVDGGNAEGHARELALDGGDNLGHGLGGASGRGDDVAGSGTATTPVLAGRGVDDSLGGGHGVDGGHETLLDLVGVVDGLDHGGEAVGGARSARHVVGLALVVLLVHTHDDGEGVVLGGGGEDNLLGATVDVGLGGVSGEENTGGLAEVLGAGLAPADVLGVTLAGADDAVAVDDKIVTVNDGGAVEAAVDGVVLELVGHVVGGGGAGVDVDELHRARQRGQQEMLDRLAPGGVASTEAAQGKVQDTCPDCTEIHRGPTGHRDGVRRKDACVSRWSRGP